MGLGERKELMLENNENMDDSYFFAGLTAVAAFAAWLIRVLMLQMRDVIEKNTEALTCLRIIIESRFK